MRVVVLNLKLNVIFSSLSLEDLLPVIALFFHFDHHLLFFEIYVLVLEILSDFHVVVAVDHCSASQSTNLNVIVQSFKAFRFNDLDLETNEEVDKRFQPKLYQLVTLR